MSDQTIPVGYKLTEVGIIPTDWEVKEISDLAHFMNGKAHENFISNNGKFIVVNSKFISTNGVVKKYSNVCFCPVEKDSILMVMSDIPNGKAIAKCFMVNKDNVYTLNQRICSLKPKIVPGFLMYKINRNPYYLSFDDGVKQTNLRRDDVLGCKLGIPKSKEEQTRIATVLSDMDELISQLDELIAKKKAIKQGAMQSLLTPKEDWEVKKLGEICELQNGYSFKSSTYTPNGKYLIVTIANVQDGYMDTSECNKIIELPKDIQEHQELNLGDLLISMTGNVGRVCKVDTRNTLLNQRVGRLNPINVEVSFLYYLLNDRKFIKQMIIIAQGGAQCNLSKKDIDNYEVNIPTSREEQIRIATILSDMDNEIQELEQKKAKYEQIKQGAMQQLLTGKIRLK